MTDPLFKAGFDHPCRQTCSGWKQGFERGEHDMRMSRDKMYDTLSEIRLTEMKWITRHSDLERKIEAMNKTLKSCRAAMDYAYEDHVDQYYLNIKNLIDATLEMK